MLKFSIRIILLMMISSFYVKAQDATSITKDFLNKVQNEDYESARNYLESKLKVKLHPVALHSFWTDLEAQAGYFKSLDEPKITDTLGGQRLRYTATFSKRPMYIIFQMNSEQKISGLETRIAPIIKVLTKKENEDSSIVSDVSDSFNLPEYAHQDQYIEKEIQFKSGGYTLPGVLTLPKTGGKWPVVVLIQDQGPLDRDGTMGPNKPMRDIAIGLAQSGVASFRWDKRGLVYKDELSQSGTELSANKEIIEDAISAIYYVRTLDFLDRQQVYIAGFAMGGYLCPLIALHAPYLAGIIMMNSNALSYDLVLKNKQRFLGFYKNDPDSAQKLLVLDQKIRGIMKDSFPMGISPDSLPGGLNLLFWKDIKNYSPAYTTANLKMPVFIMQGTRDYEVSNEDLDRWKITLRKKTNKLIKTYNVNHMLQEGNTDVGLDEEYTLQSHVPHYFIEDIAEWVKKKS